MADFEVGAGLGMLTRNRERDHRGVSYGGVAIVNHLNKCTFKVVELSNPENFEVLAASGRFTGYSREVVVLACYLPPNLTPERASGCLQYVRGAVTEIKRKFTDPYIIVSGDFNQWKVNETLEDFPDLTEVMVGPTRGSRSIDHTFANLARSVTGSGTLPPLETDGQEGAPSDHLISYVSVSLPKIQAFTWLTYSYRYFNEESVQKFRNWIVPESWGDVLDVQGSQNKAVAYQAKITGALESCFPLITVRRKSTDPPWINAKIRTMIRRRRGIYRQHGRSAAWKRLKKKTLSLITKRRQKYEAS